MSHTTAIILDTATLRPVAGAIYYSTVDTLWPKTKKTPHAAWKAYSKGKLTGYEGACTCDQSHVMPVLVSLPDAFYWKALWCPKCKYILGPLGPGYAGEGCEKILGNPIEQLDLPLSPLQV